MDHNSYPSNREKYIEERMRKIEERFSKAPKHANVWEKKPKKTTYKYNEESDYGSIVDKKKQVPKWTPEDQALEDILWAS